MHLTTRATDISIDTVELNYNNVNHDAMLLSINIHTASKCLL